MLIAGLVDARRAADGRKHTASASNALVGLADGRQYELGQGPCILAWASGEPVLVNDAVNDQRWPEWARAAAELGLRSSVSAPLLAGEVKLYFRHENSFDHTTVRLLELFAAQATIFLINVQARESARTLRRARKSLRDVSAELVSSTQLPR